MKKTSSLWQRLLVVFAAVVMCLSFSYNAEAANALRTTITAPVMTSTSTSGVATYTYSYTKSNAVSVSGSNVYGMVIPIKVTKVGDLEILFSKVAKQSRYSISAALYSDSTCTTKIGYTDYSIDTGDISEFSIPAAGTYYLAIFTTYYSTEYASFTNSISLKAYEYRADSYTLSNGKTYVNADYDSSSYRFYKISVPAAGHILVTSNSNLSFYLCKSNKTTMYSASSYLDADNARLASFYLPKGTYYIKTYGSTSGPSTIKYNYYALGASKYTLTSGKTLTFHPGNSKNYTYLKFKPAKTGYLKLTLANTDTCSAYVTLCNSSRKALSKSDYDWIYNKSTSGCEAVVYGLKKGTTYYIRVKSSYDTIKLKASYSAVTEKSGATKAKAVKLSSGKTVKGTITAASSTADWYKFTLSSAKKVTVTFKGSSNDKLKITVYDSKGKSIGSSYLIYYADTVKLTSSSTNANKLSKGTYYIKIQRYNSYSSGYYTLMYK